MFGTEMKTNNGKRLMAAIAVLALIACAFVALMPSENVNGELATTDQDDAEVLTAVPEAGIANGTYYINTALTGVKAAEGATDINLIIGSSGSVAFDEAATVTGFTIMIGTIGTDGKVDSYNGISYTATAVTEIFKGVANGGLSTNVDITGAGIAIEPVSGDNTYYATGATVSNISISYDSESSAGDVVTVTNGTATVSQGTNRVSVTATSGSNTVTAGATFPVIAGSGFTIENGIFADNSATVTNGVKITLSDSSNYYTNQIVSSISGVTSETVTITAETVTGAVVQKSSVGNSSLETDDALDVTLVASSTFTINDNVSVYANITASGSNTVNFYGALYNLSSTKATIATGFIGPNGYFNENVEITSGGASNTNVTSGENYVIYGEPSSPSVGDAILGQSDDGNVKGLIIPEGTTFTVTGNLGLNGKTITVYGTLVIDNRASIYGTGATSGEGIILMDKGTIQNNGTIGKMLPVKVAIGEDNAGTVQATETFVTMQGVSGVNLSIDKNDNMIVTGDVTATTGAKASNLTLSNVQIGADFSTAKKVGLTLSTAVTVAKNASVILNGNVSGAFAINLSEGSSISVNGSVTGTSISAAVGEIENANSTPVGKVQITSITNVTGFTMYVEKVGIANETDNTTDYYLRAYVNGSLAIVNKETPAGSISISGDADNNVYVAAGETLTVGEYVALTMTNVTFEGTVVIVPENEATQSITNYIGATYGVDAAGENNSTITTVYYTSLAEAMKVIGTVNDDGITAVVDDLDFNVTVADGQYLNLTVNGTIEQDAILTVENGGTLTGTVEKVDGKMVIQVDADSITPIVYDVMSTAADETVTYAGIAVAIAEAQPGDKITVGSATIGSPTSKQSLTIPQGVEVTVTEDITIYGDLTVANEATLIGGTINMARPDSKVTVNGTLDLSEGDFSGLENFTLTSAGTTTVSSIDGLTYNGARYAGDDGTVITSVASAVAYATENEIDSVNIHGKVSYTSDLVVDGVNIVLDNNAEVTLGNVTLTDAYIDADAAGALLTATVSGMNGEGDAAVNGTVSVSKSNLVVNASELVNAAGTTEYTYTISAINGTMTVRSGTVVISSEIATADESKFTVASGATLMVAKNGDLTVMGAKTEFTVDGTLTVDEGEVAFTAGKNVINGTAAVSGQGTVTASALVINGVLTVSETENDEGTFTVTGDNVVVGDVKTALGSTGSIVGIIGFDNANYIIAYAGTDMTGAKLADDAEFKTTAFYVNDALYATVYAVNTIANQTLITDQTIKDIDGISQTGNIVWTDADGEKIDDITTITIGDVSAVYADAPLAEVTITVSMGSQISLFVDGVKPATNEISLTIGTHKVEATVNPGFTGDVTITFNGVEVTDGQITITADMAGKNVVLSATGSITVDSGSSASTGGSSDDGMGLTDYLLIILVILIVVMAIMVAMRLMRS